MKFEECILEMEVKKKEAFGDKWQHQYVQEAVLRFPKDMDWDRYGLGDSFVRFSNKLFDPIPHGYLRTASYQLSADATELLVKFVDEEFMGPEPECEGDTPIVVG